MLHFAYAALVFFIKSVTVVCMTVSVFALSTHWKSMQILLETKPICVECKLNGISAARRLHARKA